LIQSFPPSVIKTIVIQNELIDEVEKDEPVKKKAKGNRNPDVDTSFLPDRDREEEENKLHEELRQV
jgi:protein FAM50